MYIINKYGYFEREDEKTLMLVYPAMMKVLYLDFPDVEICPNIHYHTLHFKK